MEVELFEALDMSRVALAKIVKWLLQTFHLTDKVVAYVKDEGANLATLVVVELCGDLRPI